MGIKERIAELQAQKQATEHAKFEAEIARIKEEADAARTEEKTKRNEAQEKHNRFLEALPEALTKQQQLFNELEQIGLIDMVKEIAFPSSLAPNKIDEYKNKRKDLDIEGWYPDLWNPWDESRYYDYQNKQLVAVVNPLEMDSNEIIDPSVRITIRDKDHSGNKSRDTLITYTLDRLLSIDGENTTFKQRSLDGNFNIPSIETALAEAVINPKETDRPYNTERGIRGGVRRSRPQPRLRSTT